MSPTPEKLMELWRTVQAYRDRLQVTCPETIHQTDRCAEQATCFMEDCIRIVGYGAYDEDDNLTYHPPEL